MIMLRITTSCFLALILTQPVATYAGTTSYVCDITEFHIPPSKDRNLRNWVGESAMETTVAIDRKTGRVIHPTIGNTSWNHITLLNSGSTDWAFKVMADSGVGGHIRYYEVHEFVPETRKPFVAVADGITYLGSCN